MCVTSYRGEAIVRTTPPSTGRRRVLKLLEGHQQLLNMNQQPRKQATRSQIKSVLPP